MASYCQRLLFKPLGQCRFMVDQVMWIKKLISWLQPKRSAPNPDPRYSQFVEHPRYGKGPRLTKLVPTGIVFLVSHREGLIPHTAVKADVSKQQPALYQVTHYYDLERNCRDCQQPFIFFALEQKHWYEVLQFHLESDCVHCVPCRKTRRLLK